MEMNVGDPVCIVSIYHEVKHYCKHASMSQWDIPGSKPSSGIALLTAIAKVRWSSSLSSAPDGFEDPPVCFPSPKYSTFCPLISKRGLIFPECDASSLGALPLTEVIRFSRCAISPSVPSQISERWFSPFKRTGSVHFNDLLDISPSSCNWINEEVVR
jgi:hypothetical protein